MFGLEDKYITKAMKEIRSSKLFQSVNIKAIGAIALMIKHNGKVSNQEMKKIVEHFE